MNSQKNLITKSSFISEKKNIPSNEMGNINNEKEFKENFSSKSLEVIKQKKLNRLSLTDSLSNKKLASDNIDYDPVFK